MAKNWYDYTPIQDFGQQFSFASYPVQGIDIPMPQDTPVTALFAGQVSNLYYDAGGGQAIIKASDPSQLAGIPYYYYVHLDNFAPNLQIGSFVNAGDLIGYSGGQNVGGSHPSAPNYSSGPHLEIGESKTASIPYTAATITPDLNPAWMLQYAQQNLPKLTRATGTDCCATVDCQVCAHIPFVSRDWCCSQDWINQPVGGPVQAGQQAGQASQSLGTLVDWISNPVRIIKLIFGIVIIISAIFLMVNPKLQSVGGIYRQVGSPLTLKGKK